MSMILHEDAPNRVSLMPILRHDLWEIYKRHEHSHWVANDIDFSADIGQFNKLDDDVKKYICGILSFFASSDLIINRSIEKDYAEKINILEAKIFLIYQEMMENVHTETYSLLIEAYFPNQDEKEKAHNAILYEPTIEAITGWLLKWVNSDSPISIRVLVNAIYEWVLFTGKFCGIFWICSENGKLPSLKQANEYISRDEGIHVAFSALLYNNYIDPKYRVPQTQFYEILQEAIDLEMKFVNHILPVSLIRMNANDMIKYIKHSANVLAELLHYEQPYPGVEQPFEFMNDLDINVKHNFFERPVTQYKKLSTGDISDEFLKTIKLNPKSPKFCQAT